MFAIYAVSTFLVDEHQKKRRHTLEKMWRQAPNTGWETIRGVGLGETTARGPILKT